MFFDPDTDEDVYQDQSDVTCPECDYHEDVMPDVLGYYSRRHPHTIEWSFVCDACGHEWNETEDLREEP